MIDCNGEKVFEKRFLSRDGEIPKIFSFTKFKREWVEGDFHRDASGRPIIIPNENGELVDRQGRQVNQHGMLVDKEGNVITKVGVRIQVNDLDRPRDVLEGVAGQRRTDPSRLQRNSATSKHNGHIRQAKLRVD